MSKNDVRTVKAQEERDERGEAAEMKMGSPVKPVAGRLLGAEAGWGAGQSETQTSFNHHPMLVPGRDANTGCVPSGGLAALNSLVPGSPRASYKARAEPALSTLPWPS